MANGLRPSQSIASSIDDLFYCWIRKSINGPEEEFKPDRGSSYWKYRFGEKSYTDFLDSVYSKPADVMTVSLRSKELFDYGSFEIRAKLPRGKPSEAPVLWFGFELDDLFAGGVAHFGYWTGTGALKGFCGGAADHLELDLTRFLPEDHSVNKHWYKVNVLEDMVVWYVDSKLRGISLIVGGEQTRVIHEGQAYSFGICGYPPSRKLPVLLDIDGGKKYDWDGLNPWDLRVSDGIQKFPLLLPLEDENGLWQGRTTQGKLYSHAFPGTRHSTVQISSSSIGKAELECSIDGVNWHAINSAEGKDITLFGNGDCTLYRVIYEAGTDTKLLGARVLLI